MLCKFHGELVDFPDHAPLTRIFWPSAMAWTWPAVAPWSLMLWSLTLSISFFFSLLLLSLTKASVQLNQWKESLDPDIEITPRSLPTATPHKLMLHLSYWWLFILLHRPFVSRKSRPIHGADREIDHVKVSHSSLNLPARDPYKLVS